MAVSCSISWRCGLYAADFLDVGHDVIEVVLREIDDQIFVGTTADVAARSLQLVTLRLPATVD